MVQREEKPDILRLTLGLREKKFFFLLRASDSSENIYGQSDIREL